MDAMGDEGVEPGPADAQEVLFDLGVELGGRFLELMRRAEEEEAGDGVAMFKGCMSSVGFGIAVVCARGLIGMPGGDEAFDAEFGRRGSDVRRLVAEMGAGELSYQALKLVNDDKLRRLDREMARDRIAA